MSEGVRDNGERVERTTQADEYGPLEELERLAAHIEMPDVLNAIGAADVIRRQVDRIRHPEKDKP